MSCTEFSQKGFLFIFNELSEHEADTFRQHLTHCESCRESFESARSIVDQLKNFPSKSPDASVRHHILAEARNAQIQISNKRKKDFWNLIINRIKEMTTEHSHLMRWAFPTAALLVLMTIFLSRYIQPSQQLNLASYDSEWQDHFFAEADYINGEITRVQSGELLVASLNMDEDDNEPIEENSISDNIDDLRSNLEEFESIYYTI